MKKNLGTVKDALQNFYLGLLHNGPLSDIEIKNAGQTLQKILLTTSFSVEHQRELVIFMEKNKMLPSFQRMFEKFETNQEADFARSLIKRIAKKKNILMKGYPTYSRYVISLKNEIRLAGICSTDKVAFVGSGPFPITAILVHKFTHAHLDCIEIKTSSANLSKKVIAQLGYNNSIRVINNDALRINYSQYTVIIFAILAKPLDKLIETVWRQAAKGTRMVYRSAELIRQAFYKNGEQNIPRNFDAHTKGKIGSSQTISSVLLVKN